MRTIDLEHHFVTSLHSEAMRTNKTSPRADGRTKISEEERRQVLETNAVQLLKL